VRKLVLSWDSESGIAFISGKKAFRRRGTPKMKELVMRDSKSVSSRSLPGRREDTFNSSEYETS